MKKDYSYFRILNNKTGLFFQRNGYFGKTARMYPAINQLKLSVIENDNLEEVASDLIIQEIKVSVSNEICFSEFKENALFEREQKEAASIEISRKKEKDYLKKRLLEIS